MSYDSLLTIIGFIILLTGSIVFLKQDPPTKEDIFEELKEPLLLLFLYAEKKGWTGPEKMKWCISQILAIVPVDIDYLALEEIAQKLYNEYSDFIKKHLE